MRNTKRLISALLSTLILISAVVPAYAASFSDTNGHWASAEINRWSSLGIIEGSDGRFRPDDPITRAEMAAVVDRIMSYRTASVNTFSDLPNTWYTSAVLRANFAGVILGDGSQMRPTDYITRQEAAVLLSRALGIGEEAGATGFNDDSSIASWARPYVKAMNQRGLISGVGGNAFAPADRMTRASVVKLLDNAISVIYTTSGGYSSNVAGTVIINASGVMLSNMSISGDLIIAEGVGNGNVSLTNVNVTGTVYVRGGGSGTIEISNSSISVLQTERRDGTPRIYVSGGTGIGYTHINSSAILEEAVSLSGNGFGNLRAASDSAMRVDLIGSFGSLIQRAAEADYRITGYVSDIQVLANCEFTGDFSYLTLDVTSGAGCKINGEVVTGNLGTGLHGLSITSSSPDGAARVGDVLTAATVTSGSVSITYRWYWASANISLDSASWNRISGANSKTYTIPSTMNGRYIKVEAETTSTTLSAKLSSAVGSSAPGTSLVTIENYSATNTTKNESMIRFVFANPMAFASSTGTYTAIENNYDFKYSSSNWFAVKVGTSVTSYDDSYIASAIYSTLDNSITVTLAGDAAVVSNKVSIKLNSTLYNIYGTAIKPADCPTAVRMANCSSWQNGGTDGSGPFDTTAPTLSVASAGNSSTVLRIVFNEPLGYIVNGIYRPVPDGYNFKNSAGATGLVSIKLGGNIYSNSDELVSSAFYSSNDRSVTIALENVSAEESVTISPLISFHDIFGNALTPVNSGVFYRRASEVLWYNAANQTEADAAAAGSSLSGSPAFVSGISPAKFNTPIVVDSGSLNVKTGLTYKWYRSDDPYYGEHIDTHLATGTKYTPVEADIGKYLVVVVTSSAISGQREIYTGPVEKADATVKASTVTVNYVAGGVYNLNTLSGLFTIDSDGTRRYKFPSSASYPGASFDTAGTVLTVPGAGEYEIQVEIAVSNKYNEYIGTETATLKVIDPAPRTIAATVLGIPTGHTFTDVDLGKAWFSVNVTDQSSKVYIKNSTVSSSTALGEALGRGDSFISAGYTRIDGTVTNNTLEGTAIPGGSVSAATGGTFYLVETDSNDKVVATGVVTLTKHSILARVTVTNNCVSKDIDGYAYTASTSSTSNNTYVAETVSPPFHTIYLPLDTYYLTLYQFTPSTDKAPTTGGRYAVRLTFDSCRTTITVNDDILK